MPVLIPLEANGKRPAVKGWANADFESPPNFAGNVGLRTDGLVVIDCDSSQAVEWWLANGGLGTTEYTVATRRGRHFYYRLPEGQRYRPGPLAPGVDIKTGPGAYVLIPPSTIDGFAYRWEGSRWAFEPERLQPAPHGVIGPLLAAQAPQEAASEDEGWELIPEGRRNATLTALAGALRRQGAGVEMIAATLATVNRHRCVPSLEDHEIVTIVRSVMRYEPDPDEVDGDIQIIEDDGIELTVEGEERPRLLWTRDMVIQPPPEWHFFPYIPVGRLVLVDGNEGIGKGMFATWAATQMASGGFGDPGNVLWGSTEDDPEEDIQRRLLAAGHEPQRHAGIAFLQAEAMDWRYPGDIRPLAEEIRDNDVKLLILDPGRSFLGAPAGMSQGEFSFNSEAHLRPGLEKLSLLARKLGVTVLFIHHWNKNLTASIRVRSGGSAAFAQVVRHRVTLVYVSGKHAMGVEKSNMTSREFTVRGYELPEVEALDTARFVWGDPYPDVVDLDEWEAKAKGEDDLEDHEETVLNAEVVKDRAEAELQPGARFWNRDELKDLFGLNQRLAKAVLRQLRDDGVVHEGPGRSLMWEPRELGA